MADDITFYPIGRGQINIKHDSNHKQLKFVIDLRSDGSYLVRACDYLIYGLGLELHQAVAVFVNECRELKSEIIQSSPRFIMDETLSKPLLTQWGMAGFDRFNSGIISYLWVVAHLELVLLGVLDRACLDGFIFEQERDEWREAVDSFKGYSDRIETVIRISNRLEEVSARDEIRLPIYLNLLSWEEYIADKPNNEWIELASPYGDFSKKNKNTKDYKERNQNIKRVKCLNKVKRRRPGNARTTYYN